MEVKKTVKPIVSKDGVKDLSGAAIITVGMSLVNDPETMIAGIVLVIVGFGLSILNTIQRA